jgi:hypothetical protein
MKPIDLKQLAQTSGGTHVPPYFRYSPYYAPYPGYAPGYAPYYPPRAAAPGWGGWAPSPYWAPPAYRRWW